jgi:hypothetical protein
MGRVISTGTPNQSPGQRDFIRQMLGEEEDFYLALARHEHVYYMGPSRREILSSYYLERYGMEITYVDDLDSPYLARMMFTPAAPTVMEFEP